MRDFMAGGVRRNQLDSLRFLAISAVLFDHCVKPLWFAPGGVAVRLFLLISGFLITRTFVGKDRGQRGDSARLLASFYGRRSLRIWPLFYGLLIVLLVTASISRQQFVYHGLFLTNFLQARSGDFDHPWFLAHLWTLSVQEQFYVVWPVLFLALTDKGRLGLLFLAVTTAALFRAIMWATGHTGVAFSVLPFASLDALGLGALLAAFPRLVPDVARTGPIIFGSSLICVAFTLSGIEFMSLVVAPTLWLVPLLLLTRAVFEGIRGPIGKLLELRPLIFLGRISLGIYLLHLPIWYGLTALPEGWNSQLIVRPGWPAFLIVSAATCITAALSWYALEKPLQRLRKYLPYEDATATAKVVQPSAM
jgi:peptidoglycan/LPS O-acetylase OafA/YrhL